MSMHVLKSLGSLDQILTGCAARERQNLRKGPIGSPMSKDLSPWGSMICIDIFSYPMLRADSRFWLVNNREKWSRISRLTSSAWDITTKERHWWRHNGDSDCRPLSLPLRYDLLILCLYGDLGQINVMARVLKLRKRFRMSQILFEHGINSLPLVCFRG